MRRIDVRRASRNTVRACFALLALYCAAPAFAGSDFVLTIEDDLDYAQFGQVVDYRVTLANEGATDATDVSWSMVVTDGLDGEAASWVCYGAGAGATCGSSGDGLPAESGVSLPAGRSLTWVVAVPVRADTPDVSVDAAAVLDAPISLEALDSNVLVLLRDGFDVGYPLLATDD